MAPLDPTNTGRVWVDYQANTRLHTVMFRYEDTAPPSAPPGAFMEQVADFMDLAAAFMPTDYSLQAVRYSGQGEHVSHALDVPSGITAGAYTLAPSDVPAFISFVGRTFGGRRTRIYFLGIGRDPSETPEGTSKYRLTTAQNAAVAALQNALDTSLVVGIDNTHPDFHEYANLGYNAYWQRKARG